MLVTVASALLAAFVFADRSSASDAAELASADVTVTSPIDPPETLETRASDTWPVTIAERLMALPRRVRELSDAPPPASVSIAAALEPIVARAARSAAVAVAVHDVRTGALVFRWDAERSLIPASNHKLLTAVAALELLGPQFRFETTLHRDGDTLYLRGEGDPSLQVKHLTQLLREAALHSDLSTIRKLVFDASAFSERAFGPGYDTFGPGYSYMAPSGALSLQFNTVEITVRGNGKSRAPRVFVNPPCDYVQVRVSPPGNSRTSLHVTTSATDARTIVYVSGGLASGRSLRVRRRIYHPARFTASVLKRELEGYGSDADVVAGTVPAHAQRIASLESPPLRELLGSALRFSNNFTAEQILRALGQRATGEPGDWNNGGRVLWRYWQALGIDPTSLEFENAAGLSTRGRMSAASLSQMLLSAVYDDDVRDSLRQTLATAGREGTLHARLRRLRDRVQAKTGTLDGASALSGWLLRDDEPAFVFSILVNDAPSRNWARRLQDTIVMTLDAHLQRRPRVEAFAAVGTAPPARAPVDPVP